MNVPFEHTSNTNMQAELDALIKSSSEGLANRQKTDGHWQFELEADATMPVEYIFFMHYMDCLLYTSPSPRDRTRSRMPSSA